MDEVVRINLDNEMDLILAHKRTIKLAELCGLSLSAQTTFATAVSEISRCSIGNGKNSTLVLGITSLRANKKEITASVFDEVDLMLVNADALSYARRLIGELETFFQDGIYEIRLHYRINFSGTISPSKIIFFKEYFKSEPPLSPYDEIRKKNIQLIDLSEKLQQSENQYRILTDTLPLMMFSLNPNGEVLYANKWLKDFLSQYASATSFPWPSVIHRDDFRNVTQEWSKSQLTKTTFRSQARLQSKEKNKFTWHLITIVPLKNDKEQVTNWIGFFVDIDAQKLIEETLKDNKELKQVQTELQNNQLQLENMISELNISNHSLEQFAYIASHDLQEPLRKIKTFTDILGRSLLLDDKQRVYFDKIISSSDRMSKLIRDVLNYSQLSDQEKFIWVDLNRIVADVLIDLELLIREKNAVINVAPLQQAWGIPLQLTQLFSNLINNALKFSEGNPVINIEQKTVDAVEIEQTRFLNPAVTYNKISITDNGIGFEQKYASQIFNIFQRLNDQQTYAGTGIGLALCKKIADNHNGLITASGELNKGSTFNIYLPISNQTNPA